MTLSLSEHLENLGGLRLEAQGLEPGPDVAESIGGEPGVSLGIPDAHDDRPPAGRVRTAQVALKTRLPLVGRDQVRPTFSRASSILAGCIRARVTRMDMTTPCSGKSLRARVLLGLSDDRSQVALPPVSRLVDVGIRCCWWLLFRARITSCLDWKAGKYACKDSVRTVLRGALLRNSGVHGHVALQNLDTRMVRALDKRYVRAGSYRPRLLEDGDPLTA